MSLFDDDAGEMSRHRLINDRDAEAILTGSSPDAEFDELTQFLGRIKHVALDAEPTMSAALATLLFDLSNENGDLSATTASNVHGPALQVAELPKRRSRMPIQFATGLSLAAKFALGAGLAAAGATGAAAAGVLPDPVQHAAAAVVRTVTPFEVPDVADDPTTALPPAADEPTSSTTFGARVSEDAKGTSDGTPGVDGATISSEAKAKHDDSRCTNVPTSTTVAADTATDDAATEDATPEDAATEDAATEDAATDDAATEDNSTEAGAPADHPGCKPAADDAAAAEAPTNTGKPAAPGQNGLDTAASTPAAGHVPTSTPGGAHGGAANGGAANGGAANGGASNGASHQTPNIPATPAVRAVPAVPPSDDAPASSAVPAVPATPATAPSVPEPPAAGVTPPAPGTGGTETPPSTPGSGHHS